MRRHGRHHSNKGGAIVLLAFLLTLGLVTMAVVKIAQEQDARARSMPALTDARYGLDVTTVTPCLAEDGPGETGPVPCAFTSTTTGPYVGYAWVLYVERCPVDTVQSPRDVRCIGRVDWSGQ